MSKRDSSSDSTVADENVNKRQRTDPLPVSNGTFKIVSSDGKEFCIERHYLLSASSVFRDMLSVASGPPELTLTDTDMETGQILEGFITLITEHQLSWPKNEVNRIIKLVHFLQKYNCDSSLYLIRLHMERSLLSEKLPGVQPVGLECFVVGAHLDEPDLCTTVLHLEHNEGWDPTDDLEHGVPTFEPRGMCFNPQSMSRDFWRLIPSDYLWALNRAWGASRNNPSSVHLEFEKFLKAAKAYAASSGHSKEQCTEGLQSKDAGL